MALSNDLVSQIAKTISNNTNKTPKETTVYGTTVMYEGRPYVRLDGSDLLTPVTTTSSVGEGDRVTVMIKNHTATVTGNTSDPSASSNTVKEYGDQITEFEIVMAYKVSTQDLEAVTASIQNLIAKTATIENADIIKADIEQLHAKFANIEYVNATDVEALNADIENLRAEFAKIGDLTVEEFDAITADIDSLKGYTADFTYVSADVLSAFRASIKELEANKITTKELDAKYANIDFANIGEAAVENFLSKSGIVEDIVISEGHVTGRLVGVTIIGDLIEGGTVKADKLVVLGEDGLYYKLNVNGETVSAKQTEYNSLHGSIITAKSVTAEKVNVNDLVAFDATIAGLNMTSGSIYSGAKSTVDNTTRGFYMDKTGQLSLGDQNQYVRYYKDQDGVYRLEISAGSVILQANNKTLEEAIEDISVGGKNLIRNSVTMIYQYYYFEDAPEIDGQMLTDEAGDVLLEENDKILYE